MQSNAYSLGNAIASLADEISKVTVYTSEMVELSIRKFVESVFEASNEDAKMFKERGE